MERHGLPMPYMMRAENYIARRMRALGLQAIQAKKFKVTTDSNHSKAVAPDLLEQNLSAAAANQKWTSDISYVWPMRVGCISPW